MRLRTRQSPLLLLLLPSVAIALATPADTKDTRALSASSKIPEASPTAQIKSRYDSKSKVAPFDGKDGKPHAGPFVASDKRLDADDAEKKDLPPLKGRPEDPTMLDGKKIPDVNDGVMDDRTRERPKEGTTGTGGGVSEKDKARKQKEVQTGEKVGNTPATPKEAPPLPHSEEEKILNDKDAKKDKSKDKGKDKGKTDAKSDDVSGLEVRERRPPRFLLARRN